MAEVADAAVGPVPSAGTGHQSSASGIFLMTAAVALFGCAYGADAYASGQGLLKPVLASALINGGASQIAASGVLRTGGPAVAAILVGLALNLRFLALGIVISPSLPHGRATRLLSSQLVSDLPVGVAIGERLSHRWRIFLITGALLWGAWVGGTLLGAAAGRMFNVAAIGANGAITASFISLTVDQVSGWRAAGIAAVAFTVTALLLPFTPGAAVLAGAAAGLAADRLAIPRPGEVA
jgi:predicted branched-subunit amino acid permease